MLQRLPIALAQVRAGIKWNEIRQIIYSLYQEKEIAKKVYNNIKSSINLQNRMDTIFRNSKNSGTSDPHTLLLNLTDKINLKRSDKYVALSNLSIYYKRKNIKMSCKNNNFISSDMEWGVSITWWIMFYTRYSRIFWVYNMEKRLMIIIILQ